MTIYFLQEVGKADGPIKIGFTAGDVKGRVNSIQTGYPGLLCVLATRDGSERDEMDLHARWRHLHVHGEWFRPDGELLGYVKSFGSEPIIFARNGRPPSLPSPPKEARKPRHWAEWLELVRLEPELGRLYNFANEMRDDESEATFCANHRWIGCSAGLGCPKCLGGLKPRLVHLVGWRAGDPKLKTSASYDIAYQTIYNALPGCRNCGCW